MKTFIAWLLLGATVLASPAFAQSGARSTPQSQGKALYQDRSRVYQGGARIHQHGIDPDPPFGYDGRFTLEEQRIIDRISRSNRFGPR